jgi:hypothetical protein
VRVLGRLSRDNDGLKWEKEEREMNIEHEGKTYEVLTIDRISEITHARLAGGAIWLAKGIKPATIEAYATLRRPGSDGGKVLDASDFTEWGIQPLRLVPKEPVTFEATFALSGSSWYPLHHLSDGLAHQNSTTKRFRCVEIVEEESILKAKGVDRG